MDARERLRRYLEQRRELGEQELVLDRLAVDDVLRMVGALGSSQASETVSSPPDARASEPRGRPSATSPSHRSEPASADETGPGRSAQSPPAQAAEEGSSAKPGSLGDWRETLRAAGGAPPGQSIPARTKRPDESGEADEMIRRARNDASGDSRADGTGGQASQGPTRGRDRQDPHHMVRETAHEIAGKGGASPEQSTAVLPPWVAELGLPAGLSIGTSARLDDAFARLSTLEELARSVEKCTRCALHLTATHAVPGDGNPHADLVCVGEAPGANEDATGHAFVGSAGQLLTKILAAINLTREDVFICNVLKHRPPANRNPAPEEVQACSPYLLRQLELVRPKVILTLGAFAAQTLLETRTPIGKLRGQVHLFHGIPLVVTYHPAALLRNSAWKRPTWEDVQFARRLLDSTPRSGA